MTGDGGGPRGVLLVDKPGGWTSHDVVGRVRRLAGTRRVGHAGTLDPMATGLLVLGVGQGTRLLTYLVGLDKSYRATIRLGESTTTDDAEGDVTSSEGAAGVTLDRVRSAAATMTGQIAQVPSAVSAIKVNGQRAYARVRAGEQVDLAARPVTIHRFDASSAAPVEEDGRSMLDVDVEVDCSSGTYVRALARDLGRTLGTGGHLTSLRRTRVGPFSVADAADLDSLSPGDIELMPLWPVARELFDGRELTADEVRDLRHGKRIDGDDGPVVAAGRNGELVALLEQSDGRARSLIVFPPAINDAPAPSADRSTDERG